jgi:hypothetical protein
MKKRFSFKICSKDTFASKKIRQFVNNFPTAMKGELSRLLFVPIFLQQNDPLSYHNVKTVG